MLTQMVTKTDNVPEEHARHDGAIDSEQEHRLAEREYAWRAEPE